MSDFYYISLKPETDDCCSLSVESFYGIYFCGSVTSKNGFFAEETFDLPLNVADLIFAIQEKQPNFSEFNLRLKDFNISIFQNIPLVLQKKKKKNKKNKRKEKNYVDNKLDWNMTTAFLKKKLDKL